MSYNIDELKIEFYLIFKSLIQIFVFIISIIIYFLIVFSVILEYIIKYNKYFLIFFINLKLPFSFTKNF